MAAQSPRAKFNSLFSSIQCGAHPYSHLCKIDVTLLTKIFQRFGLLYKSLISMSIWKHELPVVRYTTLLTTPRYITAVTTVRFYSLYGFSHYLLFRSFLYLSTVKVCVCLWVWACNVELFGGHPLSAQAATTSCLTRCYEAIISQLSLAAVCLI